MINSRQEVKKKKQKSEGTLLATGGGFCPGGVGWGGAGAGLVGGGGGGAGKIRAATQWGEEPSAVTQPDVAGEPRQ